MANKNGNGITLESLASDINTNTDDLIPIVERMGIRDAKPDTVVPIAIAQNIKIAKAQRDQLVKPQLEGEHENEGKEETVGRSLKQKEVKAIAKEVGLTQVVIRELGRAVHDRECQVAALMGFQEQERRQRAEEAYITGSAIAKLKQLKRRNQELEEIEKELIEEGLSDENSPEAIAASMGVDLNNLLGSIQSDTNNQAQSQLNRQAGLEALMGGKEPTEEDLLSNPFLNLAYRRSKNQ